MEKLKILFLMEDLCFGGTQKQNLELALRLDRRIFSPIILTLTGPTDLDELAYQGSLQVVHMGKSRKLAPFFFARLPQILKKLNPHILLPCTALPNIWGRIWGKILKIPVIIGTCRGGGAPARQHERILWRLCQQIVCNSMASVQAMTQKGVPPGMLTYIPNGVDTEIFQAKKKNGKNQLILCVARLAPDKDHLTLLKAFAILAKTHPYARLRLVGEGPEEKHLRQYIELMLPSSVANRVELTGACANPAPHYNEADIFVLTSIREGQPNVILEAMSSGLPVCATAVGGIPALVTDKENGFLSPPGDASKIAQNLANLLDNPELQKSFGLKGQKRVQHGFSFHAMVKAHEDLFLELWKNQQMKLSGVNNELF